MNLVFKVEKQTIRRIDKEQPADQSVNYLKATFIFGEDWNQQHIIKPLFRMEGMQNSVSPEVKDGRFLDAEGSCIVPHEVLFKYGRFFVSVLDETDGVRLPTAEVQVCIGKSGYNPNAPSVKPTPSEYETIMRDYNQILHKEIPQIDGKANNAVSTANNAVSTANKAVSTANNAVNAATSAKNIAYSVRREADAGLFKGDKGDKGDQGVQGIQGEQGVPGKDGIDGKDAVVDKSFDATSENAICAKATAQVFANALKNTASGTVIAVNDVSGIEHNVEVRVESKNIFNGILNFGTLDTNGNMIFSRTRVTTNRIKVNNSISNKLTFSFNEYEPMQIIVCTYKSNLLMKRVIRGNNYTEDISNVDEVAVTYLLVDGGKINKEQLNAQIEYGTTATPYTPYIPDLTQVSLSVGGANLFDSLSVIAGDSTSDLAKTESSFTFKTKGDFPYVIGNSFYLERNKQYFLSGERICKNPSYLSFALLFQEIFQESFYIKRLEQNNIFSVEKSGIYTLYLYGSNDINEIATYNNVMVSPLAVPYEPYKSKIYTPLPNGTVERVQSVFPNMTIFSDTDGVTINATYNADINKKFEQMQEKLANIEALALGV